MNVSCQTLRAVFLFCLLLVSASSVAAPGARTGQWQISLIPSYTDSQSIQFEGGAVADISSHSGFAIGIGYNFSDFIELDFDIGSSDSNYIGTRTFEDGSTSEKYNGTFYSSHMNLGLTYNFMASRLTPFVKPVILAPSAGGIPGGDTIADPMRRPILPVSSVTVLILVFDLILPTRYF